MTTLVIAQLAQFSWSTLSKEFLKVKRLFLCFLLWFSSYFLHSYLMRWVLVFISWVCESFFFNCNLETKYTSFILIWLAYGVLECSKELLACLRMQYTFLLVLKLCWKCWPACPWSVKDVEGSLRRVELLEIGKRLFFTCSLSVAFWSCIQFGFCLITLICPQMLFNYFSCL